MSLTWYLPTFFGDIRLVRLAKTRTRIVLTELTTSERGALAELRQRALDPGWGFRPWCDVGAFPPPADIGPGETTIDLDAPLGKVQHLLARELKPGRQLLSAVRFTDGRIEEVRGEAEPEAPSVPYRTAEKPKPKAGAKSTAEKPKPKAGATVAQPTQGCPRPDFEPANVRATRVLGAFLTDEQADDFERTGRFIVVGADTGHRYVLSSRHHTGNYGRSVFDVEERRPYCVHDYMVPPSEELLALALFLTLPGRESYVRAIPE